VDRRTDLTKLIVAFRNFTNARKKKDISTINFRYSYRRISRYECVNPTVLTIVDTKQVIVNACRGFDRPVTIGGRSVSICAVMFT